MCRLPLRLKLESFADLGGLVGQHVLQVLLLLSQHLHVSLVVLDLLVDLADHLLRKQSGELDNYCKECVCVFMNVLPRAGGACS